MPRITPFKRAPKVFLLRKEHFTFAEHNLQRTARPHTKFQAQDTAAFLSHTFTPTHVHTLCFSFFKTSPYQVRQDSD